VSPGRVYVAREIALALVRAAEQGDVDAMRGLMSDSFVGHVTTAGGGSRHASRKQYLDSITLMDVGSAGQRLSMTDAVEVEPGRVMFLVEVHAERGGRRLHNYSGQLARIDEGRISELWMVDALPAESDAFWSI